MITRYLVQIDSQIYILCSSRCLLCARCRMKLSREYRIYIKHMQIATICILLYCIPFHPTRNISLLTLHSISPFSDYLYTSHVILST